MTEQLGKTMLKASPGTSSPTPRSRPRRYRGLFAEPAVTVSADNPQAARSSTAWTHSAAGLTLRSVSSGRGGVNVAGQYLKRASERQGEAARYPHDLLDGKDAPDAVALLRKTLAAAEDRSVVLIQVGFSTNLARPLDSSGDAASPRAGAELVAKKVRLLELMTGAISRVMVRLWGKTALTAKPGLRRGPFERG